MRLFITSIFTLLFVFNIYSQDIFPLPEIPDSIKEPRQRADYLINNFWINSDLNDNDENNLQKIERSFVEFISVFPFADEDSQKLAVRNLIEISGKNKSVSDFIVNIAEKYLYNVDSPMKEEDYYLFFLDEILNSNNIDESKKIRPRYQYENVMKNRPNSKANDFNFIDRDSKPQSLYGINSDAGIILLFYDPDCDHCKDTIKYLASDSFKDKCTHHNELKILAVYSGDNKTLWDKTKSFLPEEWIVGYDDGTLQDEELYVIRTLPTLYFLDNDKTVIAKEMKEMDLENICQFDKK